jgi:DNA-directed RNA polymerase subunit RPC12/RpoP
MIPKVCPRCIHNILREPEASNALSRRDNKTYICATCGNEEAIVDMGRSEGRVLPKRQLVREARMRDLIRDNTEVT